MENADEVINIRQIIEEKMRNRGISTEYLSEKGINKVIANINDNINREIDSFIELISNKYETKEKGKKILDLLLQGKTIEEINDMEEYREYSKVQLGKIQYKKMNQGKILAVQLMPLKEIADVLEIKRESISQYLRNYTLNGKTILQIRKEKEQEVEKRLKSGQSIEEISNDRELNVCELGVKELYEKMKNPLGTSNKKISREAQKSILNLLLQGKTIEEINSMEEYREYSLEQLRVIQSSEANQSRIMGIQLMPIEEIANILKMDRSSVYFNLSHYTIGDKTIAQIREEKEREIIERLNNGQSIEEILSDKKLNVCPEFINLRKFRYLRREQKKVEIIPSDKVSKRDAHLASLLFINGKSLEEVRKMQEFKAISDEALKSLYDDNQMRRMAVRLVNINKIMEQVGKQYATVYANINKFNYGGKTLKKIKEQKLYQIRTRLDQGESIETLAQDSELNVCREVLEQEQEKMLKRTKSTKSTKMHASIQKAQERKKLASYRSAQKIKESTGAKNTIETKTTTRSKSTSSQSNSTRKKIINSVENQRQNNDLNGKENSSKNENQSKKIEPEKRKRKSEDNATEKMSKLDIMRKKYKDKYSDGSSQSAKEQVKEVLTPEENKEVNMTILETLKAVNSYNGEKTGSRKFINTICDNIRNVTEKNMSFYQIRKLASIIDNDKLKQALQYSESNIRKAFKEAQNAVYSKLADAVDAQIDDSNNVAKLEELSKTLKNGMEKENYRVSVIKSKLQRKIDKIKLEERIRSLREDIPDEIRTIISGIAEGELDVEKAKSIIVEKAAEKVNGRKATRFTLNEEQERRQYIAQIRKALNEQSDRYPIRNPEKTINLLEQLTDDTSLTNFNTVVSNQISRRKFDEAQDLCQKYIKSSKGNVEDTAYLMGVRKKIRNSKIGDLVYRTIHSDISQEDEAKFWDLLQQGLDMGNVKMSNINIGKTQDGLRTITLQDIWPDDEKGIRK